MSDAPKPADAPPPPPPPPPLYKLDHRAEELAAAYRPLTEWRSRHYPGDKVPAGEKALCEKIDGLAAEVRAYLGARLEPFPHPG